MNGTPEEKKRLAIAVAAGAVGLTGVSALASNLGGLTPAMVKAWADVLGVRPTEVILGLVIWRMMWRAHRDVVRELRDVAAKLHIANSWLADMDARSRKP